MQIKEYWKDIVFYCIGIIGLLIMISAFPIMTFSFEMAWIAFGIGAILLFTLWVYLVFTVT